MFSKITKTTKNVFSRKDVRYYILLFLMISSILFAIFLAEFLTRRNHINQITTSINSSASNLDSALAETLYNFMDINLYHYIKQSTFGQFFHEPRTDETFFTQIRISAMDSIRLQRELKSLILFRESDQTLLSTLSVRTDFSTGNPAYAYLTAVFESEDPSKPGFISTDDNVFYYHPLYSQRSSTERIGYAMAQLRFPKNFFHVDIEQLHPNGTFLILNNHQICFVEGYNILSREINENEICVSPPPLRFFTYDNADISRYNFYCVPSENSYLMYVYYEPAITGIAALQLLFREDWIMPFLLICSTMFLFFLISVYLLSKIQNSPESNKKTTTTSPSFQDATDPFLSLAKHPYFSAILIEHHNPKSNQADIVPTICINCEKYLAGCQISYQIIQKNWYVHCYFNHSEHNNIRVLSDSIKQVLYNSIDNCQFNIYYTTPCSSINELLEEVQYLQHAVQYSQVFGYSKRFSSDWLKKCDTSTTIFDTNTVETMQKLLNEKKFDELIHYLELQKEKINELFSPIIKNHYSYYTLYQFMDNAFFVLKGYFLEKSFAHPITNMNMANVVPQYSGIQKFADFLIQGIMDYKETNQTSSSHEKAFMDAVYLYIDQNLSTVTLNSMAEHFHITAAHLSRMFKRYNEHNFSEYLSEKKLQKAIILLEQPSKVSINDISKELGYSTPSYFHTKFKEYYGITPSAYHKNWITLSQNNKE